MKSPILKSAIPESKTFIMHELIEPYFDPHWHFHEECQLFVVLEGTGTRFVGDNISHFGPGDMVFTGANLPHIWRSDEAYFENPELLTRGIVVYFSDKFMGNSFLQKEEMNKLKELLEKAKRGLQIVGHTRDFVASQMKKMIHQSGFDGVLSLLQILHKIAESSDDVKCINQSGYLNTVTASDSERMQAVHDYILNNYKGNIRLEDAAELASLSPTSFSRYFKTRTNKTFSDFVTELRIGQACKLLLNDDHAVTRIAFECGYKTLSHFNRKFKDLTGTTPLQYKKAYREMT